MAKIIVGLDCECYDPLLKTAGYSWKYGQGYVLNTALYFEDGDEVKVIAGLNNDNCPYSKAERGLGNAMIEGLLKNPEVSIVGANLQYDIGWLLYEYKMTTYDVKCSFIDVLTAEHMLDEFSINSLDTLSWKYLRYGKKKERIEDWVHEKVSSKGDFRQYLKDAPWELLAEYVSGDAKNPVKIWRKQLTLLKKEDLCKRTKLEFDCILPILQITINGYPVDMEQKKKNLAVLDEAINKFHKEFIEKYNLPKFRVTASKDIASFFDLRGVPYRYAISLTGFQGKKFSNGDETDKAYNKAKQVVSSFRLKKGKPVAYVPKEMAERTCDLLKEEGFMFNSSPNIDKKYFESKREAYPEVALIADWKLAEGIKSKILGDKFNRFIAHDKDGEDRAHGQFKISDTATNRLASVQNNMQQIPSKGGFTVHYGDREVVISFPELTRALFHAEKGKVLVKADFSQEEQRLLAHYAVGEGAEEVRKAYNENPYLDFHQYVVELTGLTRKYAKNMGFGVTYGMSLASMAENFGWTMEKAEEISEAFHSKMPFIAPTFQLVKDVFKDRGYLKTVCGARARLPDPKKAFTALNRLCQGGGADILKSALVRAYKDGLYQRIDMKNTIHDEVNFCVPPTEQGVLDTFRMTYFMTDTVKLRVPLICEPEVGTDWVHVKEISEWIRLRNEGSSEWSDTSQEVRDFVYLCEKLKKEGKINYA
jgi:DNA polymerase I-like protein with 3'-5' exonuclease and polymerase domains